MTDVGRPLPVEQSLRKIAETDWLLVSDPGGHRRRDLAARNIGAASLDQAEVTARAYHERGLVTLILDERTAALAVHAIQGAAFTYEAHALEVERHAETLPVDSYGWANRKVIATRNRRLAMRLRAVEAEYRQVTRREFWGM